jgi:hypothetical protein
MYVACVLTVAGLTWFVLIQRHGRKLAAAGQAAPELAAGGAQPSRAGVTGTDGALTEAIVPSGTAAGAAPDAAGAAPDDKASSAAATPDMEPASVAATPDKPGMKRASAAATPDMEPASAGDADGDGDAKDTAAQTG